MTNLGIYGAWLTVNRYCNFRCKWCYATGTKFKSEDNMPLEMAVKLIDLLHEIGVKNVILIGGETLFWPHLFEVATYLKSLDMSSSVVTNGWLLGFEKFRNKVEKSDISSLSISLKAANRQQYLDVTGFDGFEKVRDGLREVNKWEHIQTETSVVINTEVIDNIEDVVRLAFENGSKSINISLCGPIITEGSFNSNFMPSPWKIVEVLTEKYEIINSISKGSFSIEQSLPACLWPPDILKIMEERNQVSYGCHFKERSGLIIDRWGNIIPCNHLHEYPIGQYGTSFKDLESFERFWKDPDLDKVYRSMLAYPSKPCITCSVFDKCGGGCPLYWLVRDPDLVIPEGGSYEKIS